METTELGRVGSFRLIHRLGTGSQGTTYLAEGDDGVPVALKELRFDRMEGWKALELFEREAQTLRNLDHFAIPKFVDAFSDDGHHYLVQELIGGEALSELALPLDDEVVERCARDMLDVLDYLHSLVPPIVHRDIKPANIICRPDGAHVLVDFGGVQLILPDAVGGSTIVGTTGYMPAEQLTGRATPQSDLYGLGATLVHLLTGEHPNSLPTNRMKLVWATDVAPRLQPLLDRLLEPVPEDRPKSASNARLLINSGGGLGAVGQATALDHANTPNVRGRTQPTHLAALQMSSPRVQRRGGELVVNLGSRMSWLSKHQRLIIGLLCLPAMLVPFSPPIAFGLLVIFLLSVFHYLPDPAKVRVDQNGFGEYTQSDQDEDRQARQGRLWCSGRYLMFGTRQKFEVIGADVPLDEMLVVITDVDRFLTAAAPVERQS